MTISRVEDGCVFNTWSGLWENPPEHWVHHDPVWIFIAFLSPLDLVRGVSSWT